MTASFDTFRHARAVDRCAAEIARTAGAMPIDLDITPLSLDCLDVLERTVYVMRGALQAARKYARLVNGADAKVPDGADRLTAAIVLGTGKALPRKLDLAPLSPASRDALAAIFEAKRAEALAAKATLRAREEAKLAKVKAEPRSACCGATATYSGGTLVCRRCYEDFNSKKDVTHGFHG